MLLNSFKELFLCFLSDIYIVENKLVAELPAIIKKCQSEKLKTALTNHLNETKNQVRRLEKIFKLIHEAPQTVEWAGDIRHLFADVERFFRDNHASPLLDAAIIGILQRVEHFEIATYGTLREFADVLDNHEIKDLLKESLKEECEADSKLTKVAQGGVFSSGVNVEATRNL